MRQCQLLIMMLGAMEISGDSVMERLSIHEHFSQVSHVSSIKKLCGISSLMLESEEEDVIDEEQE